MTITVAIPSYNHEKYVTDCIKSVLREKDYIDKIILIDDHSTDTTFEKAKLFDGQIECIRNEKNLGLAGNWNKCIDLCTTDWLMIFHADDEMVLGAMTLYKNSIEKYPTVGIVHADAYSMKETDVTTKKRHRLEQKEFWGAGLDAMKCKPGICSSVMVKKEVYATLGHFINGSLSTDVEMWHRIASKYDVAFINEPTAIYRINPTSAGVISLSKRSVSAIHKDWEMLRMAMASHYPDEESRQTFLKESFRLAPGGYFEVVKANIKARNYIRVFHAIWLIIFTYRASILLTKMIFSIFKKKLTKKG
jgi:glycosyltransferase involved in cell wall biosynthesis